MASSGLYRDNTEVEPDQLKGDSVYKVNLGKVFPSGPSSFLDPNQEALTFIRRDDRLASMLLFGLSGLSVMFWLMVVSYSGKTKAERVEAKKSA